MTELLSSRSNYINYRRVYNDCSGFKVPILGVHLKDLISLNEALPDYIDDDKINLSKLQHLYSNINDLLSIHSYTPPFEANKDLLHLLTVRHRNRESVLTIQIKKRFQEEHLKLCSLMLQLSLDLYYTEDEIYELSYTKEPKNPKIQVSRAKYLSLKLSYLSSHQAHTCYNLFSQDGGYLCILCRRNVFKTKAQTQCRNTSKWATSKRRTLGKRVMWWVCSFFSCFSHVQSFVSYHCICRSTARHSC